MFTPQAGRQEEGLCSQEETPCWGMVTSGSMGYLGLSPRTAIILSPGSPLWTSCHERGEAWPFKIRCKSLPR